MDVIMKFITKENWLFWFLGAYFGWFFGWVIYNLATNSEPRVWAIVAFIATPIVVRVIGDKYGWFDIEV